MIDLEEARPNTRLLGARNVSVPDPDARTKTARRAVGVVGGEVASQPAEATAKGRGPRPEAARPGRRCDALPAPGADLARIEVCGTA